MLEEKSGKCGYALASYFETMLLCRKMTWPGAEKHSRLV